MSKIMDKINLVGVKMKLELNRLVEEERGDIGIKQLAIAVGVIIVIGAVVTALTGEMDSIVKDVWDWLFDTVQSLTGDYE